MIQRITVSSTDGEWTVDTDSEGFMVDVSPHYTTAPKAMSLVLRKVSDFIRSGIWTSEDMEPLVKYLGIELDFSGKER